MYDSGKYTVDEIAAAFKVGRATLYRQLHAYGTGGDCALVVYRNTHPKIDPDGNRRYGETGAPESQQIDADRKWWNIAADRRRRLRAMIYVADGVVVRVRAVDPDENRWGKDDDRGYADVAVSAPLTDLQIATQFPTLGIRLGDHRPHVRGKIREYVSL